MKSHTIEEISSATGIPVERLTKSGPKSQDDLDAVSLWLAKITGEELVEEHERILAMADRCKIDWQIVREVVRLTKYPSLADFDQKSKKLSIPEDLEKWGDLNHKDKKGAHLRKLEKALSAADDILSAHTSEDNLLSQVIERFLPKNTNLGQCKDAVKELSSAVTLAHQVKDRGGRRPFPDWVKIAAGYMQVKECTETQYQALLSELGLGVDAGEGHWGQQLGETKPPEKWVDPVKQLPLFLNNSE